MKNNQPPALNNNTIGIIAEHAGLRRALSKKLQQMNFELCWAVGSLADAVGFLDSLLIPKVCLVDADVFHLNLKELARMFNTGFPFVVMVAWTSDRSQDQIRFLKSLGIQYIVDKDGETAALQKLLRRLLG